MELKSSMLRVMNERIRDKIKNVRKAALKLSLLLDEERCALLERMAQALDSNRDLIREANKKNYVAAVLSGISPAVLH